MQKKTIISILLIYTAIVPIFSQNDGVTPIGANTAQDLYAPSMTGRGGFTTSKGGAPASALNPAAEGDAQRIIFDIGYLGLPNFSSSGGYGNSINLGALFPTRVGVFGGSMRLLISPFDDFPVGTSFSTNLVASKELYPGLNLGLGLNFGFNDYNKWTLSGDLGFRYNMGKMGPLENFTWALVLRGMGRTLIPSMFTPAAGLSFDFVHLHGADGKPDPFRMGLATDLYMPSFQNLGGKLGLYFTVADLVTLSTSSQFNIRETIEGNPPSPIPSIGIAANIKLKSGGRRLVAGTLPSDGELAIDLAAKPLYEKIWAMGAGLTWTVGVADKTAPVIAVDYPETRWISPNNDGKSDDLEFPVSITDQRYVAEWILEITDASGKTVRTYRNKERRPETQGVRNFMSRLTDVKSGVEVPPTLRWDGILESGLTAQDGIYYFTITASDDNGNTAVSSKFTVMVDSTPPDVYIEPFEEGDNIFSPDGDGNKDTLAITLSGSREDFWEGGIYDAPGNLVKTYNFINKEPGSIVWDGTNDDGEIVDDGVYSFRISATDKALNTGSAELGNIIVNTIQPQVGITIADAWFSPNDDGIKDTMDFSLSVPISEGLVNWELQIHDSTGTARITLGAYGVPPALIQYNGRDDSGKVLPEGVYGADLLVRYRNGYNSTASSPGFTLDITPPKASVSVDDKDQGPGQPPVFSPNNSGYKDELFIVQQGSNEALWIGEIRRAGDTSSPVVKTFRFVGIPPARLVWDGVNNAGSAAQDGLYVYELFSTDQAGNSGRSNRVEFEIFTKDTPVFITTDLRAFSPNGDGVRDVITLQPQIQEPLGILNWKIEIQNIDSGTGRPAGSSAVTVRTFQGQNSVPISVPWDGRTNTGIPAPEGSYVAKLDLEYRSGNRPTALSRAFVLDITPPQAELSVPFTIFAPNGNGNRDYLPINISTEGNDEWNAIITDTMNNIVRSWNWTGRVPLAPLIWDGKDQAGNIVPDGNYSFILSSTDEAGNSTRKTVSGLVVDARIPRAILTASVQAIAPRPNQTGEALRFNTIITPQEGIESWKLELKDERGAVIRSFSGNAGAPPASIPWNGNDERGMVREGRFTPNLSLNYTKGDTVSTAAAPVLVDITGPSLNLRYSPQYFSPDNDGVDDELFIYLTAIDASPIANWSLEIRETEGTKQLFWRIEGRGSPSERIIWDGRSNWGELVQGASDYSYIYRAADVLGNASSVEGIISTDVLVIRDGDMLKIQVPSITFRANAADFIGLPQERIETNNRVLKRVAEILNKFRDYKVTVEGHANPILGTAREETEELQPLSNARANTVVEILVGHGVSRSRLSTVGRGGLINVANPQDQNNNWKNRRVEFILLK